VTERLLLDLDAFFLEHTGVVTSTAVWTTTACGWRAARVARGSSGRSKRRDARGRQRAPEQTGLLAAPVEV